MGENTEKEALFVLICRLAEKDGVKEINRLPGCWERSVGNEWWFAVNGHGETIKCSHGGEIPPINCMVEFNGWPAALFDPFNGMFAAGGNANEEAFAMALQREINGVEHNGMP